MSAGLRDTALRAWASGDLALEAAVELVVTAVSGRQLDGPWVRGDAAGRLRFDPDRAATELGGLSRGERRVLRLAMSLASADHLVDLSDATTGLDPDAVRWVLEVLAHAGGHSATADASKWTTMSPAEALCETARGPARPGTLLDHRRDLADTADSPAEHLDKTSNCPIALVVARRPATPFKGPVRDRQEPPKSPADSETGAGPIRDRRKTVARPGSAHAGSCSYASCSPGGLESACGPAGIRYFADATAPSRAVSVGRLAVPAGSELGRLPVQRPPEGPGQFASLRADCHTGLRHSMSRGAGGSDNGVQGPGCRRAPRDMECRAPAMVRAAEREGSRSVAGALPNGPARDRSASDDFRS